MSNLVNKKTTAANILEDCEVLQIGANNNDIIIMIMNNITFKHITVLILGSPLDPRDTINVF